MPDDFAGQTAVVTGGSSGIGRAIARELGARGATVYLVARSERDLVSVIEGMSTITGTMVPHPADISKDTDIHSLAIRLRREVTGLDILVHSAGAISLGTIEKAAIADFDLQHRTNLRGPYSLTRSLLPLLKARRGQIVFTNSSVGLTARPGIAQYAATKHGLKAVADSLREEVNPDGLRVTTMFLGRTATRMQATVHRAEGRDFHPERLMQPEDIATVLACTLALPRTAEVTDISMRPLQKL
jgi:NADP-dependent 3-hydroxy acid dehydrogenase YdfG